MPSQYKENYLYYAGNKEIRTVQIFGRNKKETDEKFKAFLIDFNENRHDTPLFKDFINEKYRTTFLPKLSPTTQYSYKMVLDRYIIPFLGDKEIGKITVEDIQQWFDWLAKEDSATNRKALNEKTIERASGLGRRLFRIAREMKIVDDTPFKMALLTIEAKEAGHHEALPDEIVDRVKRTISELPDPRQRLYMGLLVYTGMRREEIAGLRWENLHLAKRYGEVCQVVVYPNGSEAIIRSKTKTKASRRHFIIPEALMEILEPLQQLSGYIIHGKDPEAPAPFSTLRRTYQKAFKALGLKGLGDNHDWRATYGTQLKEANLSSAQVADLLGHADTRMVETIYAITRHEGIMKQKDLVNALNPYAKKTFSNPKKAANA